MSRTGRSPGIPGFRVHDPRRPGEGETRARVRDHLDTVYRRLHNVEHVATRVYTCRSWRATRGATSPHELQWNDERVPGERLLGSFGWHPPDELVQRIEAELAAGEAVRLFIFNSDADLVFEQILVPTGADPGP